MLIKDLKKAAIHKRATSNRVLYIQNRLYLLWQVFLQTTVVIMYKLDSDTHEGTLAFEYWTGSKPAW